MAILQEAERVSLWHHLMRNMREFLGGGESATATKAEYRMLLDDLDDYQESKRVEVNQSIRVSIRGKFSTNEKERAFALIAAKRSGLGRVGG